MKHCMITTILFLLLLGAAAQSKNYASLALYNTQTALPFGKFSSLLTTPFHPYGEAGLGKNFSIQKKHDWFTELRLGYFFHRFVQHGITTSLNIGYRYKFNDRFSLQSSIGGGYQHSIPATAKLKADENGNYSNNKGIGRMQACANFEAGAGYTLNPASPKPLHLFIRYQQRLQMPFVRSYVPLLPYNSFGIGVSKPIR